MIQVAYGLIKYMAEKKGKKQKKKSNAKKGNFPVVIILVVLGVALAIGLYSYVFQIGRAHV